MILDKARQLNGVWLSRSETFLVRPVVKGLSHPLNLKYQFFSFLAFQTKIL